jgi:uncharacterized protein
MRVVVDTNVLISAALKRQSTPGTVAHLIEQRGGLLKSLVTEQQLFEVVARPYFAALIDDDTRAWLRKLMAAAELVEIAERIAACRDPTDDKFLELAVNGHADLIVTGDADLLALNPFRDIPIVPPPSLCRAWHDKASRAQSMGALVGRVGKISATPPKLAPRWRDRSDLSLSRRRWCGSSLRKPVQGTILASEPPGIRRI